MSLAFRNGKVYDSGRKAKHCLYLVEGFKFDHEQQEKHKVLIRNGKKVRL